MALYARCPPTQSTFSSGQAPRTAMRRIGMGSLKSYLSHATNQYGFDKMRSLIIILLTLGVSAAQADERFWCLDQASSGYTFWTRAAKWEMINPSLRILLPLTRL